MEEERRTILGYRTFLAALKVIPMLLAFIALLNTVLSYFGIDIPLLSYLGGVSLFPLLFMYLASYTFRFCIYYRLFLHYVSITWVLNICDYYIGIPVSDRGMFMIGIIIACIFLFLLLYYHQKCRKDGTLYR